MKSKLKWYVIYEMKISKSSSRLHSTVHLKDEGKRGERDRKKSNFTLSM